MNDQAAVGWLHRRAGFGLHPDELITAIERGPDAELARLVTESATSPPDPWADIEFTDEQGAGGERRLAIATWMQYLADTERPFADRLTWMLHGWLVSSLQKVNRPSLMTRQIRLFMAQGAGPYPDLLRDVSVDPAMLVYLDGRTSTGGAPNENYGRELLELFALGVGNYIEADVVAAATALTGWVVIPDTNEPVFVRRRHDDTPQTLLGATDVHDVDTVIDAIAAHPAHARFVAERIVREYLGDPGDRALDGVVDELGATYEANDRRLDATVTRALELGLEGASNRLVVAPLPWLIGAMRTCNVPISRLGDGAARRVPELGQVPMLPPNVAGWPSAEAWFASSSLVARANLAATIADRTTPGEPVRIAADDGDLDLLAERLGLPEPFGPSTTQALNGADGPVDRLTLALVCPENLLS